MSVESPPDLPPATQFVVGEPPVDPRRSGWYLTLAQRGAIAVLLAASWAALSIRISLPWIVDLADALTTPVAIVVVAGIAILPGYLNVHLVVSLLFDRPPPLDRARSPLPDVAVVIAAFNEERSIETCLRYVLAQRYPGRMTVVVVDDGSTDGTVSVVEAVAREDRRVALLAVSHRGKANALNTGMLSVTTPLVATCDADTLPMPYALHHAVARLEQAPTDTVAVAGSVMVRNGRDNALTAMQSWDYLLGIGSVKREQSMMRGTLVAQGAFSVYRSEAVRGVGGWPDMIGEDIVLTWAMLANGGRTTYEPTAVAFTDVPPTLRAFLRQRRRWARGMIEGLRRYGGRLVTSRRMFTHAVASNYLFPVLDLTFTAAFPIGLVLAATGNFMIVGPMTVAVLPLNAIILSVMYRKQRSAFATVGLRMRRQRLGLLCYFLGYQLLLSPVSLSGYVAETFSQPRRW